MAVPKWVTPEFVVEVLVAVLAIAVRHRRKAGRLRS
jgi:hypothetical protein